jgi:transposase
MALPTLTPEQRTAALAKATEARRARSMLLEELKQGRTTLKEVLARADDGDELVRKTKVAKIVKALPGIGTVKAQQLLAELNIAEGRRIAGLGANQRTALIAAVS